MSQLPLFRYHDNEVVRWKRWRRWLSWFIVHALHQLPNQYILMCICSKPWCRYTSNLHVILGTFLKHLQMMFTAECQAAKLLYVYDLRYDDARKLPYELHLVLWRKYMRSVVQKSRYQGSDKNYIIQILWDGFIIPIIKPNADWCLANKLIIVNANQSTTWGPFVYRIRTWVRWTKPPSRLRHGWVITSHSFM